MKSHLAVFLLALARSAAGSVCPMISCIPLDSGVCAHKNSAGSLLLSSASCLAPLTCSAAAVFPGWWAFAPTGSTLYCEPPPAVALPANATFTPVDCLPFQPNKDFKSRKAVVSCFDDRDCETLDETFTLGSCRCGFRSSGRGICAPHASNSVFAGYWSQCAVTGRIDRRQDYEYWLYYMTYYVYLTSDISCAENIYEQGVATQLLKSMIEDSATVGQLALLALIVGS